MKTSTTRQQAKRATKKNGATPNAPRGPIDGFTGWPASAHPDFETLEAVHNVLGAAQARITHWLAWAQQADKFYAKEDACIDLLGDVAASRRLLGRLLGASVPFGWKAETQKTARELAGGAL